MRTHANVCASVCVRACVCTHACVRVSGLDLELHEMRHLLLCHVRLCLRLFESMPEHKPRFQRYKILTDMN